MKCKPSQQLEQLLKMILIRNNTSKFFEQEFNSIGKRTLMEPIPRLLISNEEYETSRSLQVSDLAVQPLDNPMDSTALTKTTSWLLRRTRTRTMSISSKDSNSKKMMNTMIRRCHSGYSRSTLFKGKTTRCKEGPRV